MTTDATVLSFLGNESFTVTSEQVGAIGKPPLYLDWLELTYWGIPEGSGQQLRIQTLAEEPGVVQIPSFSSESVYVLEVTKERNPNWIEGASLDAGTLRFNPSTGDRSFMVVPSSALKTPVSIKRWQRPGLSAKAANTDYLVISHVSLIEQSRRLAALHAARGLSTAVVDIQDVINEFAAGEQTFEAVISFVRNLRATSNGQPKFVVLVGDTTRDAHGYLGNGPDNKVLVPSGTMVSMDSRLQANDQILDPQGNPYNNLWIGRIPAETSSEMKAYVDKIAFYLGGAALEPWTGSFGFVVDDGFDKAADTLALSLPPHIEVKKVKVSEFPGAMTNPSPVTQKIVKTIDQGVSTLMFLGHGGHANWTLESVFRSKHVSVLNNTGRYPLVLSLTCLNGAFDLPCARDVLAEHILFEPKKGAIAMLAATGRSSSSGIFGRGVVKNLLAGRRKLGELHAGGIASIRDALEQNDFHLFGDPAVVLRTPLEADLDSSGRVDGLDLICWAAARQSGDRAADLNRDGRVDITDLAILRQQIGFISR